MIRASARKIGVTMMIVVLRASEIYSQPAKPGKPGKPGKPAKPAKPGRLPTGKSHFFEEIEWRLEKVALGPRAVGYTERSLNKLIEEGIAEATAERRQDDAQ
jgi:hypothetical protein